MYTKMSDLKRANERKLRAKRKTKHNNPRLVLCCSVLRFAVVQLEKYICEMFFVEMCTAHVLLLLSCYDVIV